jgi:hypothetical protein
MYMIFSEKVELLKYSTKFFEAKANKQKYLLISKYVVYRLDLYDKIHHEIFIIVFSEKFPFFLITHVAQPSARLHLCRYFYMIQVFKKIIQQKFKFGFC